MDVSGAALGAGWEEDGIGGAMVAKHGQHCVGYRFLGVDLLPVA